MDGQMEARAYRGKNAPFPLPLGTPLPLALGIPPTKNAVFPPHVFLIFLL